MSERKLYHLLDLSQLLSAAANVVIPDGVEGVLLVLSPYGLSLAVDHGVRGHDAVGSRVSLNNLAREG